MTIGDSEMPGLRPAGDRLALEQLQLVLRNLKPNCWVMPIFAAITCVIFSRWVPLRTLATWWALVAVGGAPLGIICYNFMGKTTHEFARGREVQIATLSYFLFTLTWSSFGFLFWRSGDD